MSGDIFQCHDWMASRGKKPGMLLNILQCRKKNDLAPNLDMLMTSLFIPHPNHAEEVKDVSSSPLPSPTEHGPSSSIRERAVID